MTDTHDAETVDRVRDAITDALGEAYDCMRVWSAWGYGTMSQDDFALTASDEQRVAEIAEAALSAIPAPQVKPLEFIERRNDYWDAKGTGYQVAHCGSGKWRVRLDGKVIYRSQPSKEAAIGKADGHHAARILGALV